MDLCNFTNNLQITSSLLLWQPVCGWMDDKWASPLTEPADLKQTIADRVSPEGRKIRELLSWELLRYRRGCSSLYIYSFVNFVDDDYDDEAAAAASYPRSAIIM